jgi:hypothetical protein
MESTMTSIQVFVSYAWKDHDRNEICELVRWLNGRDGIKVTSDFDFPDNSYPEDEWPIWMRKCINEADIVLCITGENYKKAFEKTGGGRGSGYEGSIITNTLYRNYNQNTKFSLILPEAEAHHLVPDPLEGWTTNLLLTDWKGILEHIKTQYKRQQTGGTQDSRNGRQTPETCTEGPVFRNLKRETYYIQAKPTFLGLRFADCPIEYVQQEDVWQAFEGFHTSSTPFSWWLIAGGAGTGKSRTALRFCEFLEQEKQWSTGFVDLKNELIKSPDFWLSWRPKQDTLLVIDYVAREFSGGLRSITSIFNPLIQRAKNNELGGKRIRILLLEREYKERDEAGQPLEWFRDLGNATRYQPPFDLGTVSDEGLYSIAQQTAKDIWNSPKPLPGRREFLDNLTKLDKKKRPLFAMLLAGYLGEGNPEEEIDPNEVLDFAIEQEFRRSLTPAGVEEDSDLLRALLLSTCTGGKLGARSLPRNHRLWDSGLGDHREENGKDIFLFHPIEPDLLGERFVLNRAGGGRRRRVDEEQLKEWLQTGWQNAPLETVDFFSRCAQDFGSTDSEKIADLFLSAMPTIKENYPSRVAWLLALVNLTAFLEPVAGSRIWQGTSELVDTPEIALCRAQAAFNLITLYGNAGNIPEARKLFDAMPDADTPEIALPRANAAVNLILHYGNAGNLPEARKLFDAMPDADTPEFALPSAQAAVNLIADYGSDARSPRARDRE